MAATPTNSNPQFSGPSLRSRLRGCLLGGAIGDALGAPIEFLTLAEIRQSYGPAGVTDYLPAYGRPGGAITDDTQMTLFTAEGLLEVAKLDQPLAMDQITSQVWQAYRRWFRTQAGSPAPTDASVELVNQSWLHSTRAPGDTCLSALASGQMGTISLPLNQSQGCGAIMRTAPIGLINYPDPFALARDAAATTHGHPLAYLSAAVFASLLQRRLYGQTLYAAARDALFTALDYPSSGDLYQVCQTAFSLAFTTQPPTPEAIESLGAGWLGHEALAIALYATLVANSFEAGVLLAVNHSGDSDSTGSLAGQLLGLILGEAALPPTWLDRLEGRETIATLADQLYERFQN